MSEEFVVDPDLPLAIQERGGRMLVPFEHLSSVVNFLQGAGYAVVITDSFLGPGESVKVIYFLRPIPIKRPWWKRLLRRR